MTEREPRRLPDTVVVGRIGRPHGVRGEVTVQVESDVQGRLDAGSTLLGRGPDGGSRGLVVVSSRPRKEGLVVRFEGFEDRDRAETLRGSVLEVERTQVPPAPPGTFYYYELIDCDCHDSAAGCLGRIVDVIEDGGGVLLEVETGKGRLLIPFVLAYVQSVDIEAARIELELPAGLLETCTSTS